MLDQCLLLLLVFSLLVLSSRLVVGVVRLVVRLVVVLVLFAWLS